MTALAPATRDQGLFFVSEQNDEGEDAQKHQCDQPGSDAGDGLAAGVGVRRRLPFRGGGGPWAVRMRRHLIAPELHVQFSTR